jgi:hypothetical protein
VNWSQVNTGLPVGVSVNDLVIVNNHLFACTIHQGIWRINIDELVGINEGTHNITPNSFSLEQNYPNPFNPVTKIKFSIPSEGYTNLKVYDALGREVETLINRNLQPGEYEMNFDASALPNGIYYYTLSSGSYTETRKMTLIK